MKKKEGGKTQDEEKGSGVRSGELNRVIRGGSFDVNNENRETTLGVRRYRPYYREFPRTGIDVDIVSGEFNL